MRFHKFIATAIVLNLWTIQLHADQEWSVDQKEAYKALLDQYPSTIEKAFKTDREKAYWHKFVTTDDPVHVHISRIPFSNYKAEISQESHTAQSLLYESKTVTPEKDGFWKIEVLGEMTPSVQSIVIFIGISSNKVASAYFQPGE